MNWILIMVLAVGLLGALELLRRQKNRAGLFLSERLKTFSARATVAFLLAFAAHIPFAGIDMGPMRRVMLVLVAIVLVGANLIRLDGREV